MAVTTPINSANSLALIRECAQRAAHAVQPEAIILFGSRATAMASDESDVDLVVVMPDNSGSITRSRAYSTVADILCETNLPTDVLVTSRSRLLDSRGRYGALGDAIRDGLLIYLAPTSNLLAELYTQESHALSKPDDYDIMMHLAEEDYSVATKMLDPAEFPDRAFGFWAQQAAEKGIKAWMLLRGGIPPYTHKLKELLAQLEQLDQDAAAYFDLERLTPYGAQLRYDRPLEPALPVDRSESIALVRKLIDHVSQLAAQLREAEPDEDTD